MRFKAIRGTYDVLPDQTPQWRRVEETIRRVMQLYGYREIRTPTFEETGLFVKGTGETTDIVGKEMYTFQDLGNRSLTLVPEGTPPIVRAYLEHSLGTQSPLVKVYYIASMYRQENPQAGRFRQHTQFGAEALGSGSPLQDLEIIGLLLQVHAELGLRGTTLRLNSIGCPACRPQFRERLVECLRGRLDTLCEDCRKRFDRNPMRILDCKKEPCQQVLVDIPCVLDSLCDACRVHFTAVQSGLERTGTGYVLDPRLVRGLDYYTRTVFEVVSGALGAQNSLGGGGRYDGLVEALGGPPTPGVGFGAGIERLLLALKEQGTEAASPEPLQVFIASLGETASNTAWELAQALRHSGLSCEIDTLGRSLKSQLRAADKLKARKAVILGDDELQRGMAAVRDLETHEQVEMPLENMVTRLKLELG
jgi:histidyl-tRNA synthetase